VRLVVTTPTTILVNVADVRLVTAEDSTGLFGIEPGFTEFLTVLTVSVLSYQDAADVERYVAVRGGVLRVHDGSMVEVATSDGLAGDDLDTLAKAVMDRYRAEADAEAKARKRADRLHLLALRGIYRVVRNAPGDRGSAPGPPEEELG
jgi:F-type H+-transporting ATPase subunit epsilon